MQKALRLFAKSNPPLYEWLGSPIIYSEKYGIVEMMRQLISKFYSSTVSQYHYLHMAQGNFREYLKGSEIWVKKYFYVLRPLLAIQWLEQELGPVPTDFNHTVEKLLSEGDLKSAIVKLLKIKRSGAELSKGPQIEVISQFIESELNRLEKKEIPKNKLDLPYSELDKLFREALRRVWEK